MSHDGVSVTLTWGPSDRVPAGRLALRPRPLVLRSPFGTAHSATTARLNVLVTLRLECTTESMTESMDGRPLAGCAEIGLPPKKPGCYEADASDCGRFAAAFMATLGASLHALHGCSVAATPPLTPAAPLSPSAAAADPFASLPPQYYPLARPPPAAHPTPPQAASTLLRLMLNALDSAVVAAGGRWALPASSGLETAIIDCWAQSVGLPCHRFLGMGPSTPPLVSFYTAAMADDDDAVVDSAVVGRRSTPLLKIKTGGDLGRCLRTLDALAAALPPPAPGVRDWSLDANGAWTPDQAMFFLTSCPPRHISRLRMLEQPFPLDVVRGGDACAGPGVIDSGITDSGITDSGINVLGAAAAAWAAVKAAYGAAGVLIYGDESVRDTGDVAPLAAVAHGLNLKMEKAGGGRVLLAAAIAAQAAGLRVWLGCMVGSALNGTATAQFGAVAGGDGDLDGALLVVPDGVDDVIMVQGGFTWGAGGAVLLSEGPGLDCVVVRGG